MNIQQLIDEALSKKEPRIRSGKYSPSSFGRCYRLQFFNRKDEPKTDLPDDRSERVFKAGNLFHEFVQQTIIANNPTIKAEVLVEDDNFKGYADLVTDDEVIDIKSQHSRAFWYRQGRVWADIEPEIKHHILQVVFYAQKLGKLKARLVYVSKDDLCIQEYIFNTSKYIPEIEQEIKTLQDYWNGGRLPKAEPRAYGINKKTGKHKDCDYCSWAKKCKETGTNG